MTNRWRIARITSNCHARADPRPTPLPVRAGTAGALDEAIE
jgi:hypothetical protein